MPLLTRVFGHGLAEQMFAEFDFEPVLKTSIRDGHFTSKDESAENLKAFLQWFSLIPVLEPGSVYVMLHTPVDYIFHSFVLNTKLYREFCSRYLGEFIDHDPMDDGTRAELMHGVEYTLALLDKHFGDTLHPALQAWGPLFRSGNCVVSCSKCSPGQHDADDTVVGRLGNNVTVVH